MDDKWDIIHKLKHLKISGNRKIFYIIFALGII